MRRRGSPAPGFFVILSCAPSEERPPFPLYLFPALPPPSPPCQLHEQDEVIWNDGVAPEAALDFDAPHISRGQVRDGSASRAALPRRTPAPLSRAGTPAPRSPLASSPLPTVVTSSSPFLPPACAQGLVMWLGGFAFFAGVFGFAYSLGHPANKISGDREIPPEGKAALGGYASGKW